ncbi:hypothetical protein ONS95_012316 [Cadophora gregata]|uniref:uncharacterized protein n=1 Tax=Cadophora gregata TaxID=51156 RepID=UPI0026DC6F5E|nr:uncharacterized protein ONS95_012316 [Cadophora gregata]KAK0118005.1 hypothetical protein ONS95_012316 [Cadophora gregata]
MTSPWSSGQPQSSNGVLNPVVAVETQWTAVNTEDFSQHEELYVAEPDTVRTNGYEKKLNNGVLFFYDEQNRATFLGDIGRWNEVDASKVNYDNVFGDQQGHGRKGPQRTGFSWAQPPEDIPDRETESLLDKAKTASLWVFCVPKGGRGGVVDI